MPAAVPTAISPRRWACRRSTDLAPIGDGAHAIHEHVEIDALVPRAATIAGVLDRLVRRQRALRPRARMRPWLSYAEVLPADDAPTCRCVSTAHRWRGFAAAASASAGCSLTTRWPIAPAPSRAVCRRWTVRHRFTRPYRPQTNGKAERFIQTLLREWAYRVPYRSSARRTAALATLSTLLQPPASACEPRSSLAVDAFPRGCLR